MFPHSNPLNSFRRDFPASDACELRTNMEYQLLLRNSFRPPLIVVACRIRWFGPYGFPSYGLGHGPNDTRRLCGFCFAYALRRFKTGMNHCRSEPMTLGKPPDLSDTIHVQINSKAGVFKPALKRQNHGLGHTGIGKPGVYIKV